MAACPICAKPEDSATRPFCSKRCADIDLGRWLTAQYVVAGAGEDSATDQDERQTLDRRQPVS